VLIVVAPGQGSQTPGMLTEWLELPEFASVIELANSATNIDIKAAGTTADAETIKNTAVAQPLIVAAGIASYRAATAAGVELNQASAFAGHSVGEFTAAAIAGVLTDSDALAVVAKRGQAMAAAAAIEATGMVAVMGGDREAVVAQLAEHNLVPANENGANQIVAAGRISDIEALLAAAPAGLRLIQLQVAGAFHTQFMQSAQSEVAAALAKVTANDSKISLISNRDAEAINNGIEISSRLVSQITNPVRWDLCMDKFEKLGVTGIVELFPGGTLTGIAKRALKGVELFPLKSPAELDNLREFASKHSN
jgi:[acyl-carrier-protein] S-malonyltransferase